MEAQHQRNLALLQTVQSGGFLRQILQGSVQWDLALQRLLAGANDWQASAREEYLVADDSRGALCRLLSQLAMTCRRLRAVVNGTRRRFLDQPRVVSEPWTTIVAGLASWLRHTRWFVLYRQIDYNDTVELQVALLDRGRGARRRAREISQAARHRLNELQEPWVDD